jgi:MFS family permease
MDAAAPIISGARAAHNAKRSFTMPGYTEQGQSTEREPAGKTSARAAFPILLAAFIILFIAFSFGLFSLPVFYPVLTKAFQWNRAQAAGGGSIVLLLIGVLGPLIGKLSDRYSPKIVALAGMCVGALALALLSRTTSLGEFYVYCVVLGIGTAAVSLVPTSMLIAPWFSRQRGLAIGVINAGVGVGGFVAPNLTRSMIQRYGFPGAFLGLAACMLIPFIATLALVRTRAKAAGPLHAAPRFGKAGAVMSMPLFWVFGLSLFFAAHTLTGIQQHLVLYLTGQGASPTRAAFALSLLLGASALGKIIGGWVADKYSTRVSMMVSILCLVAGIAGLLAIAPESDLVYGAAAVFGLGYGGVFNAPPLFAFEYFGTERVGAILGFFIMFFGLGTSSGGLVAGYLYDLTHRYVTSFSFDMASCSVAFILLLVAGRMRNLRTNYE